MKKNFPCLSLIQSVHLYMHFPRSVRVESPSFFTLVLGNFPSFPDNPMAVFPVYVSGGKVGGGFVWGTVSARKLYE